MEEGEDKRRDAQIDKGGWIEVGNEPTEGDDEDFNKEERKPFEE